MQPMLNSLPSSFAHDNNPNHPNDSNDLPPPLPQDRPRPSSNNPNNPGSQSLSEDQLRQDAEVNRAEIYSDENEAAHSEGHE